MDEIAERFPDKVAYLQDGWAVRFEGCIQGARWSSREAADIHLKQLQSGERKPIQEAR